MTFNLAPKTLPRRRRPVGGFFMDLVRSAMGEVTTIFVPYFPDGAKDLSARTLALSSVSQRTVVESERQKIRRFHDAKGRS